MITVSIVGAFDVGEKCRQLAVCGPEVVFIAGHLAAFVGLLEYIADDPESRSSVSSIATLPFVAYGPMFASPLDPITDSDFKPHADRASALLKGTEWPHTAFRRALRRFQAGESIASSILHYERWPLEQAYRLATSSPSLNEATDALLPYIAQWVASTVGWSDNLEELVAAYEQVSLNRRALDRQIFIR